MEIDVAQFGPDIPHVAKPNGADAPPQGYAVFGLQHTGVLVAIAARIITSHIVGATEKSQRSQGHFPRVKSTEGLQGQHLALVDTG